MFRTLYAALCGLLLAALFGCSALGLQTAKNVDDTIGYSKAAAEASYQTIEQNVTAGTISGPDARMWFNRVKEQRANIKLAEDIHAGIKPGGDTQAVTVLGGVITALEAVSNELKARYPAAKITTPPPKPAGV